MATTDQTADLTAAHPHDDTSMGVLREAAALNIKPIDELLAMAYGLGRARGKLEGIEEALRRVGAI